MEYQNLKHEFPPVWDSKSEILILGSFPSVKSREQGFFLRAPKKPFLGCDIRGTSMFQTRVD